MSSRSKDSPENLEQRACDGQDMVLARKRPSTRTRQTISPSPESGAFQPSTLGPQTVDAFWPLPHASAAA